MQLSDRKRKILKSIVDSYIISGEPVGSKTLTASNNFSLSSATVRNEMSELEEMGYLEQPHTSSGRVPTALGYRTYVDSLMGQYMLSIEEIDLLNELMKFKMNELGTIMEKASRIISEMTNYTSFSLIKEHKNTSTRFETVFIDEKSILLIMICENDIIKSRQLKLKSPITKDALLEIQEALNKNFVGVSADKLLVPLIFKFEEDLGKYSFLSSQLVRAIYDLVSDDNKETVHIEGATKLLSYPEFSTVSKAKDILSLLEQRSTLSDVIQQNNSDELNVLIGDENENLSIGDSSFVVHPINIDGKTIGAIGVIGPKRMDYKKVIAGLNYIVSGLTGELNEKEKNESEQKKDE